MWAILAAIYNEYDFDVASINVGEANASIASRAEIVICVPSGEASEFVKMQQDMINEWLHEEYQQDPDITYTIEKCERLDTIIPTDAFEALMNSLEQIPQGVVKMSDVMKDTVETSNNVGRIATEQDHIFISTHTRSFIDKDMDALANEIAGIFTDAGAQTEVVMRAPAWQEDQQSAFLKMVSDTFRDVLGWRPRMAAMHFVLEAGFFVQHYPGIQIASIGPRIMEPHSTSERVELSTVNDIWKVLLELLERLSV